MQTTAIRTVAKSLPQNKVILLTCLISNSYIPYTDLRKISVSHEEYSENQRKHYVKLHFWNAKQNIMGERSYFNYSIPSMS